MTIGSKLRNLRMKNRMSQEEVADHLGVKQSTIHNWESSKSLPGIDQIPELAVLYKMTAGELCAELFEKGGNFLSQPPQDAPCSPLN